MDFISKIYIEYLYDLNVYYDDVIIKQEIEKARVILDEKLSDVQKTFLEDYLRLCKKLRTCEDLHLIEFVIKYLQK